MKLPDRNGIGLCRKIKADPVTAGIAVLHLSAHFASSQDKAEALESGADGYLSSRPWSRRSGSPPEGPCSASGKGLAAAERTAEVKYALRAFLREYPDPTRAGKAEPLVTDDACPCRRGSDRRPPTKRGKRQRHATKRHEPDHEILEKYERQLLADWIKEQTASAARRPDLMQESEPAGAVGGVFAPAAPGGAEAQPGRHRGASGATSGDARRHFALAARQGFTPSETATFVFSFKEPLFACLRQEVGQDGGALFDEVWTATEPAGQAGALDDRRPSSGAARR